MFMKLKQHAVFSAYLAGVAFLGLGALACSGTTSSPSTPKVQFVYTSDAHYGITRATFQGATAVNAQVVNAAMIKQINSLSGVNLPLDGFVNAGERLSSINFVAMTGDVSNRQETGTAPALPIQPAATSWAQFSTDYLSGLTVKDGSGAAAPLFLAPGNHDVSNAIGYYKAMTPATDATVMAEIYNRMMAPATLRTAATYSYTNDKINYSKNIGGVHFVFINMWPDSGVRAWLDTDLSTVAATTPVILFSHDQPEAESKHFTNPNGTHDINATDKFENLLVDQLADGLTTAAADTIEQNAFVAWLKNHKNVVAYFHGNDNENKFRTYQGPNLDVALPVFQVDSPMKGNVSGTTETKLSFMVVSIDTSAKQLTARECLWNPTATAGAPVAWGASATISLSPRAK
jgi:hypothetical protein